MKARIKDLLGRRGKGPKAGYRRFCGDSVGAVAAVVALSATALAGIMGLGIEVSSWYMSTRKLQAAADAAAIVSAFEHLKGNDGAIATSALQEAQRHGFHGSSCAYQSAGTDCSIYNPPRSGNYTADDTAFEVELSEPLTRGFSRLFTTEEIRISSRAVAHAEGAGVGNACVLGLDPDESQTVFLDNNAGIRCGVASNSDSASSLRLDNNAFVENGYTVVGEISQGNNSTVSGNPQKTGADPTVDPYADAELPATLPGCTAQNGSGSNNITRNFTTSGGYARFCSGWDFKNNVTLNLDPGVYIIESKLKIQNNVTINATGGVTIYVRGNYTMYIKNNAVINIDAPSSGTFQGIAFTGDRTATSTVTQLFDNNAVLRVNGAIYFPNQIVMLENNAISDYCTHFIGRKVRLSNNAVIGNGSCEGTGVRPIEVGSADVKIKLIE